MFPNFYPSTVYSDWFIITYNQLCNTHYYLSPLLQCLGLNKLGSLYLPVKGEKTFFILIHFKTRGVSSVPSGVPFHLLVLFYNRSSSQFIISKLLVQKDSSIISTLFQSLFVVVVTWKRMQLFHLSLLLYWNDMNFNYRLS